MTTHVIETSPAGHKDHEGARIGMWLFLFTELLLFGGMFLLYAVYRNSFPEDFHYCAANLNTFIGGLNTLILLTSSLTMVLGVVHLERRNRKYSAIFISLTMGFALWFLVNKYFEWSAKISHGLYPNSEILQTHTPGENVFYSLYYLMTGLHAIHILIGIALLGWLLYAVVRKPRRRVKISKLNNQDLLLKNNDGSIIWSHDQEEAVSNVEMDLVYEEHEDVSDRLFIKVENAGLYWHLVDVIWIFLFPLFYLIT